MVANWSFGTDYRIWAFRGDNQQQIWTDTMPADYMYHGTAFADIDNDGYPDIFLSGQGYFIGPSQSPTTLLHNQGPDINGVVSFVDIAGAAGVPCGETALSAAFGDINNDGYVDLFITAEGGRVKKKYTLKTNKTHDSKAAGRSIWCFVYGSS